ncbi:MAG TPA: oxaloacetate decarboxylase [Rhizomicrobium sp.]|jgi:methylisocitrate lyase
MSTAIRKRYRDVLKRPGMTLSPGAYDALSARIMEYCGFEILGGGGYAAVGSMLGEPDGGQSNYRDYADHYGRICDAVDLPVFVDADTGFGGVHNVRKMTRAFERCGVAGFFISDQVFPNRCGYLPGKAIVSTAEMLARLNAALDARTDESMVIAARTDAFHLEGVDAALERCNLFMEAGVDFTKPMGLDSKEEAARWMKELPGPYQYNMSHAAGKAKVTISEVEAMGFNTCGFPSAALFAAAGGVKRAMDALMRDKSFAAVEDEICGLEDYYDIVRLKRHNDLEQDWVERGEATAAKGKKAAE